MLTLASKIFINMESKFKLCQFLSFRRDFLMSGAVMHRLIMGFKLWLRSIHGYVSHFNIIWMITATDIIDTR